MRYKFMAEVKVEIECEKCGKRTPFFVLRINPGIQCSHCGAVLKLSENEYIAKHVMLQAAMGKDDVRVI